MRAKRSAPRCLALLVLLAASLVLMGAGEPPDGRPPQRSIRVDELAMGIRAATIVEIQAGDGWGSAKDVNDTSYLFRFSPNTGLLHTLTALDVTPEELARVRYEVLAPPPLVAWINALGAMLPLLVMAGMWWLAVTGRGTNNQILSLGRHRARRFAAEPEMIRFGDVAGVDEAKRELQEIVEFLTAPQRFATLGAHIPKGVLLVGPPGTGKTLLARAVAGEACVPFFSISGAEFVEIFVGVGASRVRDLFRDAAMHAPSIVFVDEIDAIGRHRGAGVGAADDEHDQTLNQILVELDGFDARTNVIVIAATNRPDVLDPALLRPGRFDRRVAVALPDLGGREAILRVHARGKPLDATVDLGIIARLTAGFTGADLANLFNEAAIRAARHTRRSIGPIDLEQSIERVLNGPEVTSRDMSASDKQRVAYHEAGHALVMHSLEHHDPVSQISIVPRGTVNGSTRALPPSGDCWYFTRSQLKARLTAALGGRAAEQVVFGDFATGAETDIEQATDIAHSMVTQYGMCERLGAVAFGPRETARAPAAPRNYSDRTAEAIDREIRVLLDEGLCEALTIVGQRRATLARLADALVEYETLRGEALERILAS